MDGWMDGWMKADLEVVSTLALAELRTTVFGNGCVLPLASRARLERCVESVGAIAIAAGPLIAIVSTRKGFEL